MISLFLFKSISRQEGGQKPIAPITYNYKDLPNWVKAQRNSWHGVDHMYHGQIKFDEFYRNYCETLLALDESIGEVINYLKESGDLENTVIFYMGDNGFSFGEHGLIDKRQAYEESMRVPLLVMDGAAIYKGIKIKEVIQNIDIAPTILDIAGLDKPAQMDGNSFWPLLNQKDIPWRDTIFYEYYWERPFPQTPTVHAIRTDQYKFIRYYGIWDINELYDIKNDPMEMNNLIRNPAYKDVAIHLRNHLFDWLEKTEGESIPLKRDRGRRFDHIYRNTY